MTEDEKQDAEDAENSGEETGTEDEGQDEETKGASGDVSRETSESDEDVPTEIEALAAEEGWSAEDKWRGDPDKWVDARTFIRQGRTILRSTLQRQDGELSEMKSTMGEFRDHYRNVEQRAHDRAMADLKTEQRAAVTEGDTDAYDAAGKKIDELDKEAPAVPVAASEQKPDPYFQPFCEANLWYGDDIKMTAYAESISTVVGRKYKGQSFYDKITEEVRAEFPDKFSNAARKKPSRVESSGAGTMRRGNGARKTYADLPADAKAACNRFVKQKLMTRDEYIADYEWE